MEPALLESLDRKKGLRVRLEAAEWLSGILPSLRPSCWATLDEDDNCSEEETASRPFSCVSEESPTICCSTLGEEGGDSPTALVVVQIVVVAAFSPLGGLALMQGSILVAPSLIP